jgi:hypothetical protein
MLGAVGEAMEKEALSPRRQYFIVAAVQHVWQEYGLTVCYFVVYIAAITTQLSISNMVYLVFTFSCLLIHMKTRDAPFYISKFWIILVLYSGLVLISRYIYQFDQFSSWLQSIYPANDCKSLRISFDSMKLTNCQSFRWRTLDCTSSKIHCSGDSSATAVFSCSA